MFAATMMYMVLLMVCCVLTNSFSLQSRQIRSFNRIQSTKPWMSTDDDSSSAPAVPAAAPANQKGRIVVIEVPLGDGYNKVKVKFSPIFAKSKFFVSTVDVPFSLNVEKAPEGKQESINVTLILSSRHHWLELSNVPWLPVVVVSPSTHTLSYNSHTIPSITTHSLRISRSCGDKGWQGW